MYRTLIKFDLCYGIFYYTICWLPLAHPALAAGRGLECLDDTQGYANLGATMLDRLGLRDLTNRDAIQSILVLRNLETIPN